MKLHEKKLGTKREKRLKKEEIKRKERLNMRRLSYDTIQYDTVYLTCSKKLMDSQLSLPHGTNKNVKEKLKIN